MNATRKNLLSDSKGFTFIELMLVMTIVTMLAAITIPNYISYRRSFGRLYINEGLTLSDSIRRKIIDYYEFTGRFPSDNETIGLPPPTAMRGKYTKSISIMNGAINISLNQNTFSDFENKTLTIRPAILRDNPTGPVTWIKGDDELPEGMIVFGEDNTNARF